MSLRGIRGGVHRIFDKAQGVIAATLIGLFTALIAFSVDVSVATVSSWKEGYCSTSVLLSQESCCRSAPKGNLFRIRRTLPLDESCEAWISWSEKYWVAYLIYILFALLFGLISSGVTMTTRKNLPTAASNFLVGSEQTNPHGTTNPKTEGKVLYMASGSGIPEIKTILSGFVIPHFLTARVLLVKAVGAVFAVSTGMNLGKEGPFVHISTCAGNIVASMFHKYKHNERRMREMLSVACSSGLSVAFGAPIGGVLFSYEEISTYFPRQVLWRAFLCSMVAAAALKQLNPTGTGKLVLFETDYGDDYKPIHYLVFIALGIVGGIFGGVFCRANYLWSSRFRKLPIIKDHPVFEVFLVVLATAALQYPNPMIRDPGDVVMTRLLVDCREPRTRHTWVCVHETALGDRTGYFLWLVHGIFVKLFLTVITFGCKVPSGIIIPSLDAGALFGRLVGNALALESGLCALVGSAAFLAGVSRMTVSLTVVMFELTGEVTYILPLMVGILVAKWVADGISKEGVYDLAQSVLGHPFLDIESAGHIARSVGGTVRETLMPPADTMEQITLVVRDDGVVQLDTLQQKLEMLRSRGLLDAGIVVTDKGAGGCKGYIPQSELEWALAVLKSEKEQGGFGYPREMTGQSLSVWEGPLGEVLDRTPMLIAAEAPVEYAVELFGRMGLRYAIITDEGKAVGVIIKKRLVGWLDKFRDE